MVVFKFFECPNYIMCVTKKKTFNLKFTIMNSITISTNSITQFRRFFQILKSKRVLHLSTNTSFHPYTITFTTRSTKQLAGILKHLHLTPLQTYALAA